ncbi:MAG: Ig-like domain-containing protein [Armatimonadota bacterium]
MKRRWRSVLPVLFALSLGYWVIAQQDPGPPRVVFINPPNNATNVPIHTVVEFEFSELMEPPRQGYSSVDPPVLPLYEQGSQVPVSGNLTFSPNQPTRWRFEPSQPLKYNTTYEVRLTGWLSFRVDQNKRRIGLPPGQDVFRFTTQGPPDTTPPRVVRVVPPDKATNVPINQEIEVEFSEPMERTDRYQRRHETLLYLNGQPVAGTLTPNANRTVWRFRPVQPLRYSTLYTIDVSSWVDDAGNEVVPPSTFVFSTQPEPDTTPPRVMRVYPPNGQRDVPPDVQIEVEFSEVVRPRGSVATVLFEGRTPVSGQLSQQGARLTFRPAQPLRQGTTYRIDVSSFADEAGNSVAPPAEFTFTTLTPPPQAQPQPFRLLSSSIPDNAQNQPRQPRIELRFNLPIVRDSINIVLRSERAQFALDVQLLDPSTLMVSPRMPLPAGTGFTLDFGALRGVGGEGAPTPSQIRFTTEIEVDRMPPRVIASNPPRDATGTPIQPVISVTFDERVRSVRPVSSILRDPRTGQMIAGAFTVQPDGRTLVFQPQRPLEPLTTYEITLGDWQDEAGNPVEERDRVLRFTTGSGVSRQVQLINPDAGAQVPPDRSPRFRWVPLNEARGYILVITAQPLSGRGLFERAALRGGARDPFADERETLARVVITNGATSEAEVPAAQWARVSRLRNARVFWTVRAIMREGQEAGDEATQSESRPFTLGAAAGIRLLFPDPNAVVPNLLPTFRWQAEGEIELYRFTVRDQAGQVIYQAELRETALTYDELAPQPLRNGQQYLWQVVGLNRAGQTVAESEQRAFFTPARQVERIEPLQPRPRVALRTRLPYFVWRPPQARAERYRVQVFPVGSDTPQFEATLSAEEVSQLALPAELRLPAESGRALYPDSAPRFDSTRQYAWRVEAYAGEELVAASELTSFSVIEDRYIPRLRLAELQIQVNGATPPLIPSGGWRGDAPAVFVKPGDRVRIRGRIVNDGEGAATDVPVQLVVDTSRRNLDLIDRIRPVEPRPDRLVPIPPRLPRTQMLEERDYGDTIEPSATGEEQNPALRGNLTQQLPGLRGFELTPELQAAIANLTLSSTTIGRIDPGGSADFQLEYIVPEMVVDGRGLPLVALVGEGATAVKQGYLLFNAFGFDFELTTPLQVQVQPGVGVRVAGRVSWRRPDYLPGDVQGDTVSLPMIATLSREGVLTELRLSQATTITLYRFETVIMGAVINTTRRIEIAGKMRVPVRGAAPMEVPFGVAMPLAPAIAAHPSIWGQEPFTELGGGEQLGGTKGFGSLSNHNTFVNSGVSLPREVPSQFDTQAFAPNIRLDPVTVVFPPLALNHQGAIIDGELNIAAPPGKRLSIELSLQTPIVRLEPETARLSSAGLRIDGFPRTRYLQDFGVTPGTSAASALVINFRAPNGTNQSIAYSSEQLSQLDPRWWESIEQNYPTFVAFNWWRAGDQRLWNENLAVGVANLGGYIPTNLNFDPNEWYPQRVRRTPSLITGVLSSSALTGINLGAIKGAGSTGELAQLQRAGSDERVATLSTDTPMLGERGRRQARSVGIGISLPGGRGVDPVSQAAMTQVGLLAGVTYDSPPNPGNNVNPQSVNMANLPILYRELVLTPTRQIQQGEIRLVYDLGVIDSAGFRPNSARMRPVTVNDVGGKFYVGDFEFTRSPNPGWKFNLPGNVPVEVELSGLNFAPDTLADGTRIWRAISGTITPRLPSGGLRYTYAGFTLVLSNIRFELSASEQKVLLEGAIELPEAFTQAAGSTERGRIAFRNVRITASGSINGDVSLEGVSFNLGMFRFEGPAGSTIELQKSASESELAVSLRNLHLRIPNPLGGADATLSVENLTVSPQGINGTVSFNTPISVSEAGFSFTLAGGSITFNNTQVSVNLNELRFHLPAPPTSPIDPLIVRDLALTLADPSQWNLYLPLEGNQIGSITLSNDPLVRITVPDESGPDVIIDLSGGQSPTGKGNDWKGVWLRRAQVRIGGDEGVLTLQGEGLEIGSTGFTGTLTATLNPPFDWRLGGFQLRFESAQARFENNNLAELTLPNAQLTLPGIGSLPIQNLVARSGSPLRPVAGLISGRHTVQLFGMPLTIDNAGFTETGFRIGSASLRLPNNAEVAVNNLIVDGAGNLSGSLSITGPFTFNLVDSGAFQVQVTLNSAELGSGGLRVNGSVRVPIPEPLRPLKPENWPNVLEASFSDVVFNAEPRVVSGRIAFTVGAEEIGSIDAAGVHINIASALPAVGQNIQVGPFTVRLDSLSASTTNFLDVSGQATLILPSGVPITPNEIQFAFEHLQLAQEEGNWRVSFGQFRISASDPSSAVRLNLPGGFAIAVKQLVLAPQASDCRFDFWLELPSGIPVSVADSGGRTLVALEARALPQHILVADAGDPVRLLMGLSNFSPDFTLYFENIELPDLNLPAGMRAEQIRATIDFTDARSPSGKSNDWKGVLITSGRLRLPQSLGADRAVGFNNLAIGTDGLSGELNLQLEPPLQIGGESVGGFTLRITSGTLQFLPAPDFAQLNVSGSLSFPRSLAPEGSDIAFSTQIRFTGGTPRIYATANWTGQIPLVAGMALKSASGGTQITLDFDPTAPDSEPDRSFVGVKISGGSITLPAPFNEGECRFTNLVMGNTGFSGTLELAAPFRYSLPFGDEEFRVEFRSGSITLTNSRITNATLNGDLVFPPSFQRAVGASLPAQIASTDPYLPVQGNEVRAAFENLQIDMTGDSPRFGLLFARLSLPPIRFAGFEIDFGGESGGLGVDLSPNAGIEGFTDAAFMGIVLYRGAFRTPPILGNQRIGFAFDRLIIGTSGLTGTVNLERELTAPLPFVQGASVTLRSGSLSFERNRVTEFTLGGYLTLPEQFRTEAGQVASVGFDALRINLQGEFSISGVRLPPINVGGFTVQADEIAIDASRSWTPNNQLGLGPEWRGFYIFGGRVRFPTSLYTDASGNPLTIEIFSAIIGDNGKISADVRLVNEVRFDLRGANGMAIALTSARARIRDNTWQEASFSGYIELPNSVENLESPGSPVRLTFVNAAFKGNGEFFVEVSLQRCRIYGFEIAVQTLAFDYDGERSPTIRAARLLDDAPRNASWKGVYVEGGILKLPPSLARQGAEPPSVSIEHFFVDGNGVTGRAVFNAGGNLAGAIAGFEFDLREFSLGLRRNSIVEGGATIGLGLRPLTREGERITVAIRFAESGFTISISDVPPINVQNVAILRLTNLSYTSEGGGKLLLTGSVEVRPLNATAQFTNLGLSRNGLEGEIWIAPNNPLNASWNGFGVSLREVGLGTRNNRFFIGVGGDITIGVSDFSLTAGAKIAFFLDGGVDVDRIAVDFTWKDFIRVAGEFQYRQPAPNVYDFYGRLLVQIKMGGGAVGIEADVRVGRTPNFGYFGFTAVVTLPTPIQLGSLPLALYEFGGGLAINIRYTEGQSITTGEPQANSFTFQAIVGICTTDRYLLHGRVRLTVALAGGSLSSITLDGKFYLLSGLMESPEDRWVQGIVSYNHAQGRFTASLNVKIAISAGGRRIVQVSGGASLVISSSEFRISVGTPSQQLSVRVLDFINLNGYLVFGVQGGRFRIETALSGSYDFGIASASLSVSFWFRTNPFEVGGCMGASASILGVGVSGQGCLSCCPVRIKLELCVSLLFEKACIGFEI